VTEIQKHETGKVRKMKKLLQVLGKIRTPFVAAASVLALVTGAIAPMQANAANEITFVSPAYIPGTVAAFKDAIAAWNKSNPNTPVKLIPGDWGNLGDQLTTQFAAKTAPDVIMFDSISIRDFAKRGYLADLTSLMRPLQKSIPDGEWKASSYNGRLVGVPFLDQTYVVFANVDMFKKAGVAIPTNQNGVTWDEFAALAKKMTTPTSYGLTYGLLKPASSFMIMSSNFGAKWFRGYTSGRASLRVTQNELEVPLRVYDMVYKDKSIDPSSLTISAGASVAPFIAGKTAMLLMGSYAAADLDIAAKEKGFNWTVLPLLKGTSQGQGANPQTFSINALSTKKKDAARFIQFMMQDKYLSKIALGDGLVPLTSEALKSGIEAKKDSPGWSQIFADGGNFTLAPFAFVPEFAQWKSTVLQPTLQQFIQNKITKEEMVKRLEDCWKNLR